MKLSGPSEEVATFYAKLLDHECTTKEAFNHNFFKDWRKVMTVAERETISDLKKCDFSQLAAYFLNKTEDRKAMTEKEKAVINKQTEDILKEYGFCIIDGHKEKIGNFKIEPPGLFRGRGEHPKMGRHKKRILPEDVIINCSKKSKVRQCGDLARREHSGHTLLAMYAISTFVLRCLHPLKQQFVTGSENDHSSHLGRAMA